MSEQLRFQTQIWEIRAKVGLAHYAYPVQTLTVLDPSKFHRTILTANLRLERRLAKYLKLFGEYEREVYLSNEVLDRYEVNTISGGFNWEF